MIEHTLITTMPSYCYKKKQNLAFELHTALYIFFFFFLNLIVVEISGFYILILISFSEVLVFCFSLTLIGSVGFGLDDSNSSYA